jgi:hypothetical protein
MPIPIGLRRAGMLSLSRLCGGVLFALVLGFFTFGSALDSLLCHAETPRETGAALSPAWDAADHPQHEGHPDEGVCLHGHCHHPAAYAPDAPLVMGKAAAAARAEPVRADHVRSFGLQYDLRRPPRD